MQCELLTAVGTGVANALASIQKAPASNMGRNLANHDLFMLFLARIQANSCSDVTVVFDQNS
jgi:hypothetical protein